MSEILYIFSERIGPHHADFQTEFATTPTSLVGFNPKARIEPARIGSVMGKPLNRRRILRGVDVLANGQANTGFKGIRGIILMFLEAESTDLIDFVAHPFYGIAHAFYARTVGKVSARISSKKVILKLNTDHLARMVVSVAKATQVFRIICIT